MLVFFVWLVFYLATVTGLHGIQEESFMQSIMNEIMELKTRQNSCERYKVELEEVVNKLKTRQHSYEAKVSELEAVVDDLQKRNEKLEQEILGIQENMVMIVLLILYCYAFLLIKIILLT
jgi:exonuclease VII small subunit